MASVCLVGGPRRILPGLAFAGLLPAALASSAAAATYTVAPTQVRLSANATSRLLTLRNQSTQPLRFEVRAFRWDQTPQGEMVLEPTRDVVAFPALFSVAPGELRTIRVGFTGRPGATEESYRIFVEELPPAPGEAGAGVRMLTRMGIPVFIEPHAPSGRIELSPLSIDRARVTFMVRNTGNVHVLPQRIRLTAANQGGAVTLERDLAAWYVLAGGTRVYTVELPEAVCAGLSSLSATVHVAGATLEERLAAPTCGP